MCEGAGGEGARTRPAKWSWPSDGQENATRLDGDEGALGGTR